MGFTLPPELEREILARADRVNGVPIDKVEKHDHSVDANRMVDPGVAIIGTKLVIMLPVVTRSEANESAWHRKMIRKLSVKEAVRKTLGPHHGLLTPFAVAYHSGTALRVVFTRMSVRNLDRGNLAVSMKAVEDCIEGALLASDGSPLWRSEYEQEQGAVGVKVEIECWS